MDSEKSEAVFLFVCVFIQSRIYDKRYFLEVLFSTPFISVFDRLLFSLMQTAVFLSRNTSQEASERFL